MGDLSGGVILISVNARALPIYAKTSSSPPLPSPLFVHFRLAHSLLALDGETRDKASSMRAPRLA